MQLHSRFPCVLLEVRERVIWSRDCQAASAAAAAAAVLRSGSASMCGAKTPDLICGL